MIYSERPFEGYASTFGFEDRHRHRDIMDKGAFTETLLERGTSINLYDMHDPKMRVGYIDHMHEDQKGLFVSGFVRWGYVLPEVRGLSIGYHTLKSEQIECIRHIQKVDLREISIVMYPSNEQCIMEYLDERK